MEKGQVIGAWRLLTPLDTSEHLWTARHEGRGQAGVLRRIHRPDLNSVERRAAFAQAANTLRRLHGPQIVALLDQGFTPSGEAFVVRDAVDGESLDDRLKRDGALAPRDALAIGVHVLAALGAAHEQKMLHGALDASCVILGFELPAPGAEASFHTGFSAMLEGLPTVLLINSQAHQGILV